MTSRKKHEARSHKTYKKNTIPVNMFARPAFDKSIRLQAEGGLIERMISIFGRRNKARESRTVKNND